MIVYDQKTREYADVPDKQAMIMILSGKYAQVATTPDLSFWYSYDVIKGRWLPGEAVISRDSYWAYLYAVDIIRGPWDGSHKTQAEAAISSSLFWSKQYKKLKEKRCHF
jgi:hypothetical protein